MTFQQAKRIAKGEKADISQKKIALKKLENAGYSNLVRQLADMIIFETKGN